MGEEWEQDANSTSEQPNQDEVDKRLEDLKRKVTKGASEAQTRIKRVFNKASDYWQNAQTTLTPRQPSSIEEQRIRQLADTWSTENWRVARDLGTYMDTVSWSTDEVWELTLETRWETRTMELVTESYTGATSATVGLRKPLLPVWDYDLPAVTGLKAPQTRTRVEGLDEIVSCTVCNGTGHTLCTNCNGRGWIVCPECKGRTKKRCTTCRSRGYVADWPAGEKKPFFKQKADDMASALGNKVSDVFDGIRQQGVPIPNPVDVDPATKGATIPCPDCINGEVDCSCGTGKRVCANCEGARTSLCSSCTGTGKLVRHREITRRFELRTQTRILGECPIPASHLVKANGDLAYSAEINESLHSEAPPERVPIDIWRSTVELVQVESKVQEKPGTDPQARPRPSLQVVELVRIPYTKVQYCYAEQDYVLYLYDSEGNEKFYTDRYPARWDRVERLFKAISTDLLTPVPSEETPTDPPAGSYRVPVEVPPYSINEEDGENHSSHKHE
jgi:hypothetical protein